MPRTFKKPQRPSWLPSWVRFPGMDPIAWAILVVAVSIIFQTIYFDHRDEQRKEETSQVDDRRAADALSQRSCLADTIADLVTVLKGRAAPTDLERKATRTLILGAFSVTTPEEFEALKADYLETIREADQEREDHPLPDYPSGVCEVTTSTPSGAPS